MKHKVKFAKGKIFSSANINAISRLLVLLIVGISGAHVLAQSAAGELKLDNGLVKVTFDRGSGTYSVVNNKAQSMNLYEARLEFTANGHVTGAPVEPVADARIDEFQDEQGHGHKISAVFQYKEGPPSVRYEIRLYDGESKVSVQAWFPQGTYALGDVKLITGILKVPEAVKAKVYYNSGEAGGRTGVWELGIQRWESSALSAWLNSRTNDALLAGFYSFQRASTTVQSQYLGPEKIGVQALIHYNGYVPSKSDLASESVLLNLGSNPVQMLDDWAVRTASIVKPQFNHDTSTGYIDVWYTFGDEAAEKQLIEQAKLLQESVLPQYGINFVSLGEWQKQRHEFGDGGDALGFGEDLVDQKLFPSGLEPLCRQYHQLGFGCTFGANYAYAAPESTIAKQHVPWLVTEDRSRLGFGAPIDFTDPNAQRWVYNLYHQAGPIGAKWVWSDFDGGPSRGTLHDPNQIRGFEDIRDGLSAIRKAVGNDTFIQKFCCGPFFTYLGLSDRVRVGQDMVAVGDFDGLKAIARQLAGNYMLHKRFWINDPDPLFVGGREYVHNFGSGTLGSDPAIRDEVRMRLQLEVSSGGFVTLGEDMHDLGPNEIHALTQVLPPYGNAAVPIDMFLNTTPEIYDLPIETSWDHWHVLLLQNWNNQAKSYRIEPEELKLDPLKIYTIFRFWDQKYMGQYRGRMELSVDGHRGETYAIRELPAHPWVLSTDMHLTQGGVELPAVQYEEQEKVLTGTATRHPGATGSIVIFVPHGYQTVDASGPHTDELQSDGNTIVRLTVNFKAKECKWFLKFSKSTDSF